jgi:hypothetical protein
MMMPFTRVAAFPVKGIIRFEAAAHNRRGLNS